MLIYFVENELLAVAGHKGINVTEVFLHLSFQLWGSIGFDGEIKKSERS